MQGEILPPLGPTAASPPLGRFAPSTLPQGEGGFGGAGAKLVYVPNPLAPSIGTREFDVEPGLTVSEAVLQSALHLRYSTVLVRGGELVRRSDWDSVPIAPGETLSLVTLPQNGGNGGSQIGQILLTLALVALTIYTYGATSELLAADLGSTGASVVAAVAAAAVSIAGQYLISALIGGPKKPQQLTGPDYALFNSSNAARLGSPIPEMFGLFFRYPDLASVPYSDWNDNRQHLYQLFCLGAGEYEIEQIRVAQTVVWESGAVTGTYPDLQIQIVPPGGTVTLFPGNVHTSTEVQSIEMLGTNQMGYAWIGPFAASPSGTATSQINIDIALPAGLFDVDGGGHIIKTDVSFNFQAQEIDNTGTPIGSWFDLGISHRTLSMASRDAFTETLVCDVPVARYQVRGERTNARSASLSAADLLVWVALRAFLPGPTVFPDSTMIAVRAAPSANLNGTSASQFNVIATRKLPIYDPVAHTWSANTATRSIAAAAAYVCKSDNGGGLADNRIDLALLFGSLDATWSGRGDTFDGVFDKRATFWESLETVLKAGRTAPILAGEVISFVRDEAKAVYRTVFTPRNMLSNTFQTDYLMFDRQTPDALMIEYVDSRIWQSNRIFVQLPDSIIDPDDPTVPVIQWQGIVNRDQAWREGIYLCAANRYRRSFPSFRTEHDGRICFRGDLVKVSHWLAQWGWSMEVMDIATDMGGDILTLSEPWSVPAGHGGETLLCLLTTPDGLPYGPVHFTLLDNGDTTRQAQIQLTTTVDPGGTYAGQIPSAWPVWSGDGLQYERPKAVLGVADEIAQDCLVVQMRPERGQTCSVVAVVDDARVYSADGSGPPIEVDAPSGLSPEDLTITKLTVERVTLASGAIVVFATVTGAPDAVSFGASWLWSDATSYTPEKDGLGRTFEFNAEVADLSLKVRARGKSGWGPWFTGTAGSTGGGGSSGAAASFDDIILLAGLSTHLKFAIDAGDTASYAGAGQTVTDSSGNGMDFYLGDTNAAEGSDPVFNGVAGNLSVNEYFEFGTARGSGDFTTGGSNEYLTLTAANPAWVTDLHQDANNFTVAFLIYFPGHPAVLTGTDFAWISPFATTSTLAHEGVSAEFYSEAQIVGPDTFYTAFIQANVNRSAGSDAEESGYGWYATSTTPTPAGWYFCQLSVNQTSGQTLCFINGQVATSPGIGPGATPDFAAADITLCTGGSTNSMYNGSRLALLAAWDVALTGSDLTALYDQVKQYRPDFALP